MITPFEQAIQNIEDRFGVSIDEYMMSKRSPEVQERINSALLLEMVYYNNPIEEMEESQ